MTSTPAHDIAAFLPLHLVELVAGTNVKVGAPDWPLPAGQSALGVGISNTTGLGTIPYLDGGNRGGDESVGVQIQVRADKDDPSTGLALCQRIIDALNMQTPEPFYDSMVQGSGILNLGPDSNGFPRWSINVLLKRTVIYRPIFHGPANPLAITVNAAFVQGLASERRTRRNHVFAVTTGASDAVYIALPASFGTPSVFVGATARVALPMTSVGTVAIVDQGESVSYAVYVSATGAATRTLKIL